MSDIQGGSGSPFVFSLDRVHILNQKADTAHSDNDYLSLIWTVANLDTKNIRISGKKNLRVGGVLHTGDVVDGPFATDPVELYDNDILTVTMALTNLGSTDKTEDQVAQAAQVTDKILEAVIPIVAGAVGAAAGGPAGAGNGLQVGDAIANEVGRLFSGAGDIFSALGIYIGPANCNGLVLSQTLTYTQDQIDRSIGRPATQTFTGDQTNSRCGAPPHTQIDFAIRSRGPYVLTYSHTGRAAVAPVVVLPSGLRRGTSYVIGGWEADWTQVSPFTFKGAQYLLLYRQDDGGAFVAPIVAGPSGPQNGAAYRIGGWETDWAQISTFNYKGSPYLLLYRQNGGTFVAPFVAGPKGPQNGAAYQIGGWEGDWSQVTVFEYDGSPYILLYRQDDGGAFVAPFVAGSKGPQNGATYRIGGWERDWSQVTTFDFVGSPYLLLYKQNDGSAFIAPFVAGKSGPQNGAAVAIGPWEADWAQVKCFEFS